MYRQTAMWEIMLNIAVVMCVTTSTLNMTESCRNMLQLVQ